MLHLFTATRRFINFMQSGWYIDYIIKQFSELFVRNVFVYAALFFGEKFIIEFVSKKTIDNVVLFLNVHVLNRKYSNRTFYFNLILFIFLFLLWCQLTYLFWF